MRRQELLAGILLIVGSLVLFLVLSRSIEKNPPTDDDVNSLKPYLFPALFSIAALVLTAMLIFNGTDYNRTTSLNHWATAEWLLSMSCLAIGVFWISRWKPIHPKAVLDWIKTNPVEFGLVILIIIASLVVRMIALTGHPYPWSGDEASIGTEAHRILSAENTNWFNTGWSGQPNVSFLPTVFSMLLFGENIFAVRMTSVITGLAGILALYLLAREWFGRETALIASGFLVAYPFHLQFSRIGVDNIFDSLMVPLVLWLIFRAVRTKSLPTYLLAGIAAGFALYTYVGTRLVIAMGIGTFIYIIIKQKGYLKSSLPHLGIYFTGLAVTIAPMVTFFIKFPTLFMTRIGQENILLNGWLPNQVAQTGQTAWKILLEQFTQTVLVFVSQNASSNFLNFDRPYLTILGAIFFLIGLGVAFRHLFDQRFFILQAWFWSVLALGGFLTVSPPANTRLLMTIPATALFIALGAWEVSRILLQLKFKPVWVYSLNVVLLFILAFQNLFFYFGTYRERYYFQDANAELAMEAGLQLQQLGTEYDYYLLGIPRVFAGFPTTEFLNPGTPKYDLRADGIADLVLVPKRGAFLVAIPENENLLRQIIDKYPGGTWQVVYRKVREEVLYYAYILTQDLISSP
jgi:4-amino-4-deoxy-L-arabinose transferase-like glycosyltransferase